MNADRAPGQWQAFDIHFRAPRRDAAGKIVADGMVTAWLNGQQIHDHQPVGVKTSEYNPYRYDVTPYLNTIRKRQRRTAGGPMILQDHDNSVRFRNIWVKPLDHCACLYDPPADASTHVISTFATPPRSFHSKAHSGVAIPLSSVRSDGK